MSEPFATRELVELTRRVFDAADRADFDAMMRAVADRLAKERGKALKAVGLAE